MVNTAKFSGAVMFGNSDGDLFVVEPLTAKIVPNYPAYLQDMLSLNANYLNTTVETTTHTVSYPSGVWTVASATTVSNGNPIMVVLHGIEHSGHTVIIVTYALSSSATTDETTYFAPMLTSFTFLK